MSKNSLDLDYMNAKLNVKTGVKAGFFPILAYGLIIVALIPAIDDLFE